MNIHNNLFLLDAIAVLKEIQKKSPDAIIAGGFLRDLFFGKQPKDLDIFVKRIESYGFDFIVTKDYNMSYSTDEEIGSVQNLYHIGSPATLDINVIEVKGDTNAKDRVEFHDFDFCQVYFDGKEFVGIEKLEKVLATKKVTLQTCENELQYERSKRRWDRLQKKYPEFSLEVKPEFLKYESVFI
jgi:hypothetical protein